MTNKEIKNAWENLSGEKMYNLIERACREVIRQRPNMAKAACVSASELAGEAWIRIDKKLNKDMEFESVEKLVILAATEALTAAARFNQHSAGGSIDESGDNSTKQADSIGEKLEAREDINTGIKRPVENAVINKLGINAAAMDERDRRIIDGLKHGLTKREIAAAESISPAAVGQRVDKIAKRITAAIDAELEEQRFNAVLAADEKKRAAAAKLRR